MRINAILALSIFSLLAAACLGSVDPDSCEAGCVGLGKQERRVCTASCEECRIDPSSDGCDPSYPW